MVRRPRALPWLFAALLFAARPPLASAEGTAVDDETRAKAIAAAQEGLNFYDRGQYKDALPKLVRANELVAAPTIGLMIARCLRKLGRLVEASDRYLEVSKTKIEGKPSSLFLKAMADAAKEREILMPQIPVVIVEVEGGATAGTVASIDDIVIPPAELEQKRLVDPGVHRVSVIRGDAGASEEVSVREGETRTVKLTPVRGSVADQGSSGQTGPKSGMSTQKLVGFVALGVGAAGLAAGAVTGGMAANQLNLLESRGCDENHCPKSLRVDVQGYNTLRLVSTISLYAGGAAAAAGLVLVLTAPKAAPQMGSLSVEPVLGVGFAGVRGSF